MAIVEVKVVRFLPEGLVYLDKIRPNEYWLKNPSETSEPLTEEEMEQTRPLRYYTAGALRPTHRMTEENFLIVFYVLGEEVDYDARDGVLWDVRESGYEILFDLEAEEWDRPNREVILRDWIEIARHRVESYYEGQVPDNHAWSARYYTAWTYNCEGTYDSTYYDCWSEYYGVLNTRRFKALEEEQRYIWYAEIEDDRNLEEQGILKGGSDEK